ncbi:hypothetical protein TNCV_484281 [Trichonephila clavipes]|nr:hypothetical protein TNCV_832781 [Trichonephila clavipes]GFW73202.1 hypothetical protein TNCV_484281 [Trichonephila clavipes]
MDKPALYFRLCSPPNWEFWMIYQLATCDDRRPCIGLGIPPYTSKRQHSIETICAIVEKKPYNVNVGYTFLRRPVVEFRSSKPKVRDPNHGLGISSLQ